MWKKLQKIFQKHTVQNTNLSFDPITFRGEAANNPTTNGLALNGYVLPEEVIEKILLTVDTRSVLTCSAVCIKWHRIIKSDRFWKRKYEKETGKRAKRLPAFLYHHYLTTDYWNTRIIFHAKRLKVLNARSRTLEYDQEEDCHKINRLMQILDLYKPDVYVNDKNLRLTTREANFFGQLERYSFAEFDPKTGKITYNVVHAFETKWFKMNMKQYASYLELERSGVLCKLDFHSIEPV